MQITIYSESYCETVVLSELLIQYNFYNILLQPHDKDIVSIFFCITMLHVKTLKL